MQLHQIDLNLLVVFDAVYREQNLTRAAEQLSLSQPAISHALGRLRELLGDPLFTRVGRTMAPTAKARSLIQPVRQALSALEQGLFPSATFEAARSERRFHIAVRDAFETLWLPPLVERLEREAPRVRLVSVRMPQPAQLEAELAAGTVDLALDLPMTMGAGVQSTVLGAEGVLRVMARKGHPAFKKGAISLERYLAADHVLVSSRRRGPGLEDLAVRALGQRRRIAVRCQSHLAACRTVARSDLLLTLPKRMLDELAAGIPHASAPVPFDTPSIGVHLYWHTSAQSDPAITWLRTLIETMSRAT